MAFAENHLFLDNYTPVGDLAVIAVCLVIAALIGFSYIRRTTAFRVFLVILVFLVVSASLDVFYNLMAVRLGPCAAVNLLHCLYHSSLFAIFLLYTRYVTAAARLERETARRVMALMLLALPALVTADVIIIFSPRESSGLAGGGRLVFLIGYAFFALTDIILLATVRRRLYRRVMGAFCCAVAVSFLILVLQWVLGRSASFTVLTFLFPAIAMLYIMHSNPYDPEMGTIDGSALPDIVRYNYEKKRDFILMSVCLPDFAAEGKKLPESIRAVVRRFSADYFRGALLFHVDNGHLLLMFPKRANPDFEHRIERMLKSFREYYRFYHYDYKAVICESIEEISRKNEYVSLIRSVHRSMPVNTIHRVSREDVLDFDRSEYILRELEDICRKQDLGDRRVQVWCQPVYSLRTGRYDTAEALMRLNLDGLGILPPSRFITLAEENGFIHTLTRIILHKTCEEIRKLTGAGYDIVRISVNISALELKSDRFCDEISAVISESGIPGDKIALELTESWTESDFLQMKDRITALQARGIKFYLDDFGTGYSNMERILELPFDIIKFDRSLVSACGSSERSEKIVSNMARLFSDLQYSVLYEGVESDSDEVMCRKMSASYLQGYKYSRPVPITDLRRFASRKHKAG